MARWFQFQNKTDPLVPIAGPSTVVAVPNSVSVPVQYETRLQYQAQSDPTSATQFISKFVGEWFEAWTPPPKPRLAPALAVALAVSGLFATPTQPQAETVTADKWLYQWSEPVRKLSGLPSYLQDVGTPDVTRFAILPIGAVPTAWEGPPSSSTLFQYQSTTQPTFTPSAEIITADKWLYPWSEPVRVKSGLGVSQQQTLAWSTFTPAVTTAIETSTLSSPIFFKGRMIYQSRARPPILPTAETITADKWIYQWSEPVRQKLGLSAVQQQFLAWENTTPTVTEEKWHQAWSEPIRSRVTAYQQQSLIWSTFTSSAVAVPNQWLVEWSQPTLPKVVTSVATFNFMAVDKALTNYWYAPWPDFTYSKKSISAAQQQAWFGPSRQPIAEVITEDKWHFAWSEPVRVTRIPSAEQTGIKAQTIQPPTILISQWFNPLSEPIRTRQLSVSEQQSLAAPSEVIPRPTDIIATSLSSPVFFKGRMIYHAYAKPPFPPAAEVITADKWIYPWSEPVRVKRLPVADMAPVRAQTIQPPTILVSQWFAPLSEPVRVRQLPVSEQQAFAAPSEVIPRPAAITPITLSSPVFFKGRIIYQSLTRPLLPPTPEIVTADKWLYGWSEPVRFKQFPTNEQQAFTAPSKVIPTPFVNTLSSPVTFTRWVIYQSETNWPPRFITPETITPDKWIYPWSEPVRTKQGLPAQQQQSFAWGNFTPTVVTAVTTSALSSPVFFKGRVIYQSLTKPYFPPTAEVITPDKWIYPWTEPVRFKRFPTSEQQSFAAPTKVIPTPFVTVTSSPVIFPQWFIYPESTPEVPPQPNFIRTINWFSPFSEPVWPKKGLRAWLQSVFTAGTTPLATVVTVTLDATETNNDTALFGISVYNRPLTANVSIKEIPIADTAYASIEET